MKRKNSLSNSQESVNFLLLWARWTHFMLFNSISARPSPNFVLTLKPKSFKLTRVFEVQPPKTFSLLHVYYIPRLSYVPKFD
jgi:hypothetical protein